jgi:uncharacterized protein YegP (UPF0339 family)
VELLILKIIIKFENNIYKKNKMGKFVLSKRKNGEFQFNLKAGNGQTILTSEGYSTKANCENGIGSVKKNSKDDSKFDRKKSSNEKFYFNLKATNGQVIGSSEMYESKDGMENGIESVKQNAPNAEVVDETL